jgi:TP901 family phage tail tape measure protein
MASAIDALSTSLKGLVGSSDQVNTSTKNMVSSMSGAMSDSMSVIEQQRKEDTEKYRELAQEEKDIMRSVAEEDKRVAAEYKDHLREKAEERKKEEEEYEAYNTSLNELDADRAKQIEEDAKLQAKAHQEAAKAAVEAAKRAQEAAKEASESIMRMGESIMDFGQKMHRVGRWLEMKVTLPLVAAGTAATKFALDYNDSLATIQGIMYKRINNIGEKIKEFDSFILDLAPKAGLLPKEIAAGLLVLLRQLDYNKGTLNLLSRITYAAVAAKVGVDELAESAITMARDLGELTDANILKFLDMGFVFRGLTQSEIPEMGKAIGKFGQTYKTLEIKPEEALAVLAVLRNTTDSLARASTQQAYLASRVFKYNELAQITRTEGFAAALGKININQLIEKGKTKDFVELFGGSRTVEASIAIIKNTKLITEHMKKFKSSAGEAMSAFEAYTTGVGSLNQQWRMFKIELNITAITIGRALLPVLVHLFHALSPIFYLIKNIPTPILTMIVGFLVLAAALGPLIALWGNMIIIGGALIKVFAFFVSGTFAAIVMAIQSLGVAFMATWGILLIKIVAVIAAIYLIYEAIKWVRNNWDSIFNWMGTKIDWLIAKIEHLQSLLFPSEWFNKAFSGTFLQPVPVKTNNWQSGAHMGELQKSQSEVTINVKPSSGWDVIVEDVNHSKNTKLIMNTMSYLGVTR